MFVMRIDRTRQVQQPLEELLAWTRNPDSRYCWPGAGNVKVRHDTIFYYDVVLSGSREGAPISIEEHMRPVAQTEDGFEFESGFLLSWPWSSGDVASGWSSYRFSESGGVRALTYSFRYLVPGKTGEQLRHKHRFGSMMESAVDEYLDGLVAGRVLQ
jgi:hypothetical protein